MTERPKFDWIKLGRIVFVAAGIALLLFGVFRLTTEIALPNLIGLATWMFAAIVIHDGVLSPLVLSIGWVLRRYVPDRPRRYLQFALIVCGLVTVIAIPMIYLRGSQPAVKAILLRNYGANLGLIIGLVAVVTLVVYAVRVAHRRPRPEPEPE